MPIINLLLIDSSSSPPSRTLPVLLLLWRDVTVVESKGRDGARRGRAQHQVSGTIRSPFLRLIPGHANFDRVMFCRMW